MPHKKYSLHSSIIAFDSEGFVNMRVDLWTSLVSQLQRKDIWLGVIIYNGRQALAKYLVISMTTLLREFSK